MKKTHMFFARPATTHNQAQTIHRLFGYSEIDQPALRLSAAILISLRCSGRIVSTAAAVQERIGELRVNVSQSAQDDWYFLAH